MRWEDRRGEKTGKQGRIGEERRIDTMVGNERGKMRGEGKRRGLKMGGE